MRIGEKTFEEKRVLAADSNFFRVFTCKMLQGDPNTALEKPNSAVVNESTAKKYFGSTDVLGKQFETDTNDSTETFMITAVVADWPDNSHFLFDILISTSTFQFTRRPNFIGFAAHTYLLLNPNASYKALEAKFPDLIKKYVSGEINKVFNQSWEDFQKAGNGYHYYLQPLTKIHLDL